MIGRSVLIIVFVFFSGAHELLCNVIIRPAEAGIPQYVHVIVVGNPANEIERYVPRADVIPIDWDRCSDRCRLVGSGHSTLNNIDTPPPDRCYPLITGRYFFPILPQNEYGVESDVFGIVGTPVADVDVGIPRAVCQHAGDVQTRAMGSEVVLVSEKRLLVRGFHLEDGNYSQDNGKRSHEWGRQTLENHPYAGASLILGWVLGCVGVGSWVALACASGTAFSERWRRVVGISLVAAGVIMPLFGALLTVG